MDNSTEISITQLGDELDQLFLILMGMIVLCKSLYRFIYLLFRAYIIKYNVKFVAISESVRTRNGRELFW